MDPVGLEESLPTPRSGVSFRPTFTDATRAAVVIRDRLDSDIWSWHFAGQILTRLTLDRGFDHRSYVDPRGDPPVGYAPELFLPDA